MQVFPVQADPSLNCLQFHPTAKHLFECISQWHKHKETGHLWWFFKRILDAQRLQYIYINTLNAKTELVNRRHLWHWWRHYDVGAWWIRGEIWCWMQLTQTQITFIFRLRDPHYFHYIGESKVSDTILKGFSYLSKQCYYGSLKGPHKSIYIFKSSDLHTNSIHILSRSRPWLNLLLLIALNFLCRCYSWHMLISVAEFAPTVTYNYAAASKWVTNHNFNKAIPPQQKCR